MLPQSLYASLSLALLDLILLLGIWPEVCSLPSLESILFYRSGLKVGYFLSSSIGFLLIILVPLLIIAFLHIYLRKLVFEEQKPIVTSYCSVASLYLLSNMLYISTFLFETYVRFGTLEEEAYFRARVSKMFPSHFMGQVALYMFIIGFILNTMQFLMAFVICEVLVTYFISCIQHDVMRFIWRILPGTFACILFIVFYFVSFIFLLRPINIGDDINGLMEKTLSGLTLNAMILYINTLITMYNLT